MKKKKEKDIYIIMNRDAINFDSIYYKEALDWNKLPENIFNDVPEWYYENSFGINGEGDIVNKTVIYLRKADKYETISDNDYIIYEDQERIIGLEMPS